MFENNRNRRAVDWRTVGVIVATIATGLTGVDFSAAKRTMDTVDEIRAAQLAFKIEVDGIKITLMELKNECASKHN